MDAVETLDEVPVPRGVRRPKAQRPGGEGQEQRGEQQDRSGVQGAGR
jgi:hypothetical protein